MFACNILLWNSLLTYLLWKLNASSHIRKELKLNPEIQLVPTFLEGT